MHVEFLINGQGQVTKGHALRNVGPRIHHLHLLVSLATPPA